MVLSRASRDARGSSLGGAHSHEVLDPAFSQRYMAEPLARREFPPHELPRDAAFQIVADILQVDGKPRLNLASFVTTWMEPEAEKLIAMSLNKNAIDLAEYPAYAHIQEECVHMIARLFHAPLSETEEAVGTATVGSSEAFMLAALAMKRRWQQFRRQQGLPTDRPNMVAPATSHVVIDKFANYFEVELRKVPVTRECPFLRAERAAQLCDENTIGVVTLLGSTYTGHFDDVRGLCQELDRLSLPGGWQVPVHVDAASGGFVAPFLYPDLEWDFRLPRVASINVSGHKYGLAYPGVGWVVWRAAEFLPPDLVFHVNYLGEEQPTYTLNFSRGASAVVAQYYQFIRLGFEGYKRVLEHCAEVADKLREALERTGAFRIVSSSDMGIPLVAFSFKEQGRAAHISEHDLSGDLRRHLWIVPSYSMPLEGGESMSLCRVCVREDLGGGLAEWLVRDIDSTVARLLATHPPTSDSPACPSPEVGRLGDRLQAARETTAKLGETAAERPAQDSQGQQAEEVDKAEAAREEREERKAKRSLPKGQEGQMYTVC